MKPWTPPATLKLSGKPLFDTATDPFARYRVLGGALALLVLYFGASQLWVNWKHPTCRDFIAFWGAGRLAFAGAPSLAYGAQLHQLQATVVTFGPGTTMPFPYIPAFLLLVMPFGLLPYPAAMAVWVIVTLALYVISLRKLVPGAGLLAIVFPPILANIIAGQNGFLTAALFFGAISLLQRRPFVAGLLIGCLIFKPQLGLLFPLALLASRQWKAIAGAAVSSIALALAGVVAFGPATTVAWIGQLPLYAKIARDGTVGWAHMMSIYAAAREADLATAPALILHLAVLAVAASFVWRVWRSEEDIIAKGAVLACATMLASTYVFFYDEVMLALPFLWLAQKKIQPAILAGLCGILVVALPQHAGYIGAVNVGPVVPILLMVLVVRTIRRKTDPSMVEIGSGLTLPMTNPT